MSPMTIPLSEENRSFVEAQSVAEGYESPGAFVDAVIREARLASSKKRHDEMLRRDAEGTRHRDDPGRLGRAPARRDRAEAPSFEARRDASRRQIGLGECASFATPPSTFARGRLDPRSGSSTTPRRPSAGSPRGQRSGLPTTSPPPSSRGSDVLLAKFRSYVVLYVEEQGGVRVLHVMHGVAGYPGPLGRRAWAGRLLRSATPRRRIVDAAAHGAQVPLAGLSGLPRQCRSGRGGPGRLVRDGGGLSVAKAKDSVAGRLGRRAPRRRGRRWYTVVARRYRPPAVRGRGRAGPRRPGAPQRRGR